MSSLMQFKADNYPKDHICFIGTGREENNGGDQYMNMVIAKFLQMNYEHISFADGGYRAVHQMLTDTGSLSKLSNHFKRSECMECKVGGVGKSTGTHGGKPGKGLVSRE